MRVAGFAGAAAAGVLLAGCGWTTDYAGDRDRAVERARASAEHARFNLEELVESSKLSTGPELLTAVRDAVPEEFEKVVVFDEEQQRLGPHSHRPTVAAR